MPERFKNNFSAHGPLAPGILARSWCQKMQYFFNVELASPYGPDTVFTEEHHAGFQESSELVALCARPDLQPRTMSRVNEIRGLFH